MHIRSPLILFLGCLLASGNFTYAQNFREITKIIASDRAAVDYYGHVVSISGTYAIVGAPRKATNSPSWISYAGAAYIYELNNSGSWVQVQKITASDMGLSDLFGWSVSISGNYAIVGAYGEDEDVNGSNYIFNSGSAYIFERDSATGTWSQVQKIVASDRDAIDYFGYAVSISGEIAIVGAYNDENFIGANNMSGAGSAYFFERDSATGSWNQVQKVVASDRDIDDNFGHAVAISGSRAIVGAYQEDAPTGTTALSDAGAAYIFERNSSGSWAEVKKLVASDRDADDYFGYAVAISGGYAIVGAYLDEHNAAGSGVMTYAGSAYIYERNGGSWNQEHKIVASDRTAIDLFGRSVSISGNYALVGANSEDEDTLGMNTRSDAGSGYIFKRNSNGTWLQEQKIVASDRSIDDYFGFNVSLSGNNIVVGAYGEDDDLNGANAQFNAGSAYIFTRCPSSTSSIADTVCSSYTSPSGKYTWTTSGIYKDTVPNFSGCDSIITITLTAPSAPLSISSAISQNPSCYNSFDGQIILNLSGGIGPYSFLWNTGDTLPTLNNLDSGTYSVIIVDGAGCSISQTYTLTKPDTLKVSVANVQNVSCYGAADGQLGISVSGGGGPYSIIWNTGDTTLTLQNIGAGNYWVAVTDSLGCTESLSYNLPSNDSLSISVKDFQDVLCKGASNGLIELSISGGHPPYNLTWSSGHQDSVIRNLKPGLYTVQVTDSRGCFSTEDYFITEPANLKVSELNYVEARCGKNNGELTVEVSGGTKPYDLSWSNGESGPDLENLGAGQYTLIVQDSNDCRLEYKTEVIDQSGKSIFFANAFTPNGDGINDIYEVKGSPDCFTDMRFQIFNRWGEKLFETTRPFDEFWNGSVNGWRPLVGPYHYVFTSEEYSESGYLVILR